MFTFLLKDISDYYCSEPEKKGQQDLTKRRKEERSGSPTTDDDQKMRSANRESFFTGNFAYEKFRIALQTTGFSDIIALRNRGIRGMDSLRKQYE